MSSEIRKDRPKGPVPPTPRDKKRNKQQGGQGGDKGGKQDKAETEAHAREVREIAKGRDIVDKTSPTEKRPPAFDRKELMVVRSWVQRRPLEPKPPATALIQYPRMWSTKRGRYCKFKAPGAGVYGLLRARPSF